MFEFTTDNDRVYVRHRATRLSVEVFPSNGEERAVVKLETRGGRAPIVVLVDDDPVLDRS